MFFRNRRIAAFALLAVGTAINADEQPLPSVSSETHIETKEARVAVLKLGVAAKTTEIRLNPLVDDDIKSLSEHNRQSGKALQIGIGRDVPSPQPASPLSSALTWTATADGGRAAQVAVTSPGARGLRLGIAVTRLDDGVEMRFFGAGKPQNILGPIKAATVRAQQPIYWSPVTEGETTTLEVYLPPGLTPESAVFDIPQLSHLVRNVRGDWQKGIGDSGECQIDVACVSNPSQALLSTKNAVARMVYTKGSSSYLCTGTLLNDTDTATYVPYFYSASHCISEQATAATLNTYWFFEAATCGGDSAPNSVQKTGGAVLLYNSPDTDAALLRLNDAPPGGAIFAGWNAGTVASGTDAIGIHHPAGDLKKFSRGVTQGYQDFNGAGSFIAMQWSAGVTEGGSSGSGLFVMNNGGYQLRGGLKGGTATCDNPQGMEKYSRLDQAYPYIQQYIYPATPGTAADKTATEFYNTNLKHYFLTTDPSEAAAISSGAAGAGWIVTGGSFKVWGTQASGSVPVCRFYGSVSPGPNSHFFTADAGECASLQAMQSTTPASQPRWNYEGTAYYAYLPSNASCGSDKTPIHRYYNNGHAQGQDANHRLTTDTTVRESMEASGWIYEGITMCGGT